MSRSDQSNRRNRRPVPRESQKRSSSAWLILTCVLLTILIGLLIFFAIRSTKSIGAKQKEINEAEDEVYSTTNASLDVVYTYDGAKIRIYTFKDPDTNEEYLVSDHGGITPRLENDISYVE